MAALGPAMTPFVVRCDDHELCLRQRRNASACVGIEDGGGAGGHARAYGIGARGEDDRYPRAEDHSRRVRLGEERQVFGQHVPGLEIGHDENLRAPGDERRDALIFAASGSMALSKASGPSRIPPVICPRSAILQSAAASIVDGIFGVTVSTAERIATRGVPSPTWVNRSITF